MSTIVRASASPAAPVRAVVERLISRVRAAWRRALLARAVVAAPAAVLASALVLLVLDLAVPLPAVAREVLRWLPPLLGAGIAAAAAVRIARPPSPRRFALLAEERVAGFGNRLVTAYDAAGRMGDGPIARAFLGDAARALEAADLREVAPLRLALAARVLAASAGVLALFAAAAPGAAAEAWERWTHPADTYESTWREVRARTLPAVTPPPPPEFDELRWRVEPPPYTGLPSEAGRGDDVTLVAVAGSRVSLRGRFPAPWEDVRAVAADGTALPITRGRGEWTVAWRTGVEDRGLTLEALSGGEVVARRVLAVVIQPDLPPDVQLLLPERDLVLASGTGRLPIRASATDDFGVAGFDLHWTRTRGSGELFEFVEGDWDFARVERSARAATGELVLDLGSLGLEPGDVMHIRAVARDRNDVTGPGESVSRTRVVRVARPDELDQVNIDIGIPPELPDDPVLSQRMIVLRTEALRDRMRRIAAAELTRQGAEIGRQQGRLRENVGEQIFIRSTGAVQGPDAVIGFTETGGGAHAHDDGGGAGDHGHDHGAATGRTEAETLEAASAATGQGTIDEVRHAHDEDPIIDVNRTILRIYNLMWESERRLNQAMPDSALPFQYEALRLIQQVNQAERVFARGTVRVDPIDVAGARGEGKLDEADPARRAPGAGVPGPAALVSDLDRGARALGRVPPREASLALSALAARVLADPAGDAAAASLLSRAATEAGAGRTERARELLSAARARIAPAAGAARRSAPPVLDPAAAEYFRRLGDGS